MNRLICGIKGPGVYGPFLLSVRRRDLLMADKPTYEELERRGTELEKAIAWVSPIGSLGSF